MYLARRSFRVALPRGQVQLRGRPHRGVILVGRPSKWISGDRAKLSGSLLQGPGPRACRRVLVHYWRLPGAVEDRLVGPIGANPNRKISSRRRQPVGFLFFAGRLVPEIEGQAAVVVVLSATCSWCRARSASDRSGRRSAAGLYTVNDQKPFAGGSWSLANVALVRSTRRRAAASLRVVG